MSGRGKGKRVKASDDNDSLADKTLKKAPTKKKQFPVVAVITPEGIEGSLLTSSIRRPLVVHLSLQSKDVPMNDMPIIYDPMPPTDAQPYDCHAENPFYETLENLGAGVPPSGSTSMSASIPLFDTGHDLTKPSAVGTGGGGAGAGGAGAGGAGAGAGGAGAGGGGAGGAGAGAGGAGAGEEMDYYRLKSTILVQYKDSSEVRKIPSHSDVACLWCCHTFTHRPVVLPMRDTGDHIIVMGNFCCPECACSHLFDMRVDAHTRWEQLALLYRVYGGVCGGTIHPAPPRTVMTLFGGCLSIQQYRQMIRSYKVRVDIHLPPMVSILATMDTKPIDFYDASLTKNVTETVTERLQKAEEVLRLRRTKPLKAWESTLDACINLKIKYDSGSSTMTSGPIF